MLPDDSIGKRNKNQDSLATKGTSSFIQAPSTYKAEDLKEIERMKAMPIQYTIYTRNLVQTVSRNLCDHNEVITGSNICWKRNKEAIR